MVATDSKPELLNHVDQGGYRPERRVDLPRRDPSVLVARGAPSQSEGAREEDQQSVAIFQTVKQRRNGHHERKMPKFNERRPLASMAAHSLAAIP